VLFLPTYAILVWLCLAFPGLAAGIDVPVSMAEGRRLYVCVYVCMYVCIGVWVCVGVWVCGCVYVCMGVCIDVPVSMAEGRRLYMLYVCMYV
jgi:hypothetical protein